MVQTVEWKRRRDSLSLSLSYLPTWSYLLCRSYSTHFSLQKRVSFACVNHRRRCREPSSEEKKKPSKSIVAAMKESIQLSTWKWINRSMGLQCTPLYGLSRQQQIDDDRLTSIRRFRETFWPGSKTFAAADGSHPSDQDETNRIQSNRIDLGKEAWKCATFPVTSGRATAWYVHVAWTRSGRSDFDEKWFRFEQTYSFCRRPSGQLHSSGQVAKVRVSTWSQWIVEISSNKQIKSQDKYSDRLSDCVIELQFRDWNEWTGGQNEQANQSKIRDIQIASVQRIYLRRLVSFRSDDLPATADNRRAGDNRQLYGQSGRWHSDSVPRAGGGRLRTCGYDCTHEANSTNKVLPLIGSDLGRGGCSSRGTDSVHRYFPAVKTDQIFFARPLRDCRSCDWVVEVNFPFQWKLHLYQSNSAC